MWEALSRLRAQPSARQAERRQVRDHLSLDFCFRGIHWEETGRAGGELAFAPFGKLKDCVGLRLSEKHDPRPPITDNR